MRRPVGPVERKGVGGGPGGISVHLYSSQTTSKCFKMSQLNHKDFPQVIIITSTLPSLSQVSVAGLTQLPQGPSSTPPTPHSLQPGSMCCAAQRGWGTPLISLTGWAPASNNSAHFEKSTFAVSKPFTEIFSQLNFVFSLTPNERNREVFSIKGL